MNKVNVEIKTKEDRDDLIKQLQEMEFEPSYPTEWEEIAKVKKPACYVSSDSSIQNTVIDSGMERNAVPDMKTANALLALTQLLMLREEYYKIDGVPNFNNHCMRKYTIIVEKNKAVKQSSHNYNEVLAFVTKGARDHFFDHHKELIDIALPLL